MGQVNCRKHYLSLRKSLVLYVIAFVVLAVFLSVATFFICGSAAEDIRSSYPPSGEKYYLTNEQGEQLGDGAYIGSVPVPLSKEDERTIALLEKLPIVATPIYSAFCIIAAALLFYRNRLKKPLVELRTASEKIQDGEHRPLSCINKLFRNTLENSRQDNNKCTGRSSFYHHMRSSNDLQNRPQLFKTD